MGAQRKACLTTRHHNSEVSDLHCNFFSPTFYVRFEVLKAEFMNVQVFGEVIRCRLVNIITDVWKKCSAFICRVKQTNNSKSVCVFCVTLRTDYGYKQLAGELIWTQRILYGLHTERVSSAGSAGSSGYVLA
jgi:hypothetical protein